MLLYRGSAKTKDPQTYECYWVEIAGSQARILYAFLHQDHIANHKLAKVPCYKINASSVDWANKGQAVKANVFLSCKIHKLGRLSCSKSQDRFDKKITLCPYPNKLMTIKRFLPQGQELFDPVLPTIQENPLELKLNVIQFTEPNELAYEQAMLSVKDLDSPNLSRSTSTEILPTDFEIFRSDNKSIATQTGDTIVISDEEEEGQNTSIADQNSSIQAGFMISDNTGRVQLLSKPSDQRPLFMTNFEPIAASTAEEPKGPSLKGKSASGRGKSSSSAAPREPLRVVHLPCNKENNDPQDESMDTIDDVQHITDLQIDRTPSANNTDEGRNKDSRMPLPSPSTSRTTKTRPKRKRSGEKPTTLAKPKRKKITKVIIIDQRVQTRMDRYLHTRGRLMRIQRSNSRKPTPVTSLTPQPKPAQTTNPTSCEPISPIIPPANVTIPLPDSPNDTPHNQCPDYNSSLITPSLSTVLNIRTTDDARAAESPSVIFGDANRVFNMDNVAEITSPDIHYASEPQQIVMPMIPDPTWRPDPNRTFGPELPEHVIIEANAEDNTVERTLILDRRSDPWQVLEAIRTGAIINPRDEGFHSVNNDTTNRIVVYEDPIIRPYPFPDPVPTLPTTQSRPTTTSSANRSQAESAFPSQPQITTNFSNLNRFVQRQVSATGANSNPGPSRQPLRPILNMPPPTDALPILDNTQLFSTSNPSTGSQLFPTPDTTNTNSEDSDSLVILSDEYPLEETTTSQSSNSSMTVNTNMSVDTTSSTSEGTDSTTSNEEKKDKPL